MSKVCKIADKCGGCSFMKVDYNEQLNKKYNFIKELFKNNKIERVIGMENPYNYRHKVYATFGYLKGKLVAGMYEENSHKLVYTNDCLIQNEVANGILRDICFVAGKMRLKPFNEDTREGFLRHAYIRVSALSNKALLTIVIGSREFPGSRNFVKELLNINKNIESIVLNYNNKKTSMILGDKNRVLYGKGTIIDEIDSLKFRISNKSFYQVNPVQTEILYKTAIDLAEIGNDDIVLDACCGIGTISLLASRFAKKVVGVEIVQSAIIDAKFNAKLNGINNCEFYCSDIEKFIIKSSDNFDVVFVDPPRSGLSVSFLKTINHRKPKKIIYITCNPVTQVRDLKLLKDNYRIDNIIPVDMFPFTEHIVYGRMSCSIAVIKV